MAKAKLSKTMVNVLRYLAADPLRRTQLLITLPTNSTNTCAALVVRGLITPATTLWGHKVTAEGTAALAALEATPVPTRPAATTAPKPACGAPAMTAVMDAPLARDVEPGELIHIVDGEFAPVLGVAVTEDRQRVVITWGDRHKASKLSRTYNEVVLTAHPATIRLTKAQAELLRAVQADLVHFRPGNAGWAPGYAKRSDMFELFGNGKTSNRTLAGLALDAYGLIAYNPGSHHIVELTEPGKAWLAAHPA